MKICEDCTHKEVCKYRKKIEEWEEKGLFMRSIPKPLEDNLTCKHKRIEPCYWSYTVWSDTTTAWPQTAWTDTCNGRTLVTN